MGAGGNIAEGSDHEETWYIDSGATRHMTFNKNALIDVRHFSPEEQSEVYLGDDSTVTAVGEGKVRLATNGPDGRHITLQNVVYVPGSAKNLLSVSSIIQKNNAEVLFDKDKNVLLSKIMKNIQLGIVLMADYIKLVFQI